MFLDEYLFRSKMKATDFSKRVGITPAYIRAISKKEFIPSVRVAKAIEKATEGYVSKEEILFPEEFEEVRAFV